MSEPGTLLTPDIEAAAVTALAALAPCGTVTPENMTPPFIRVRRVPGVLPSDAITDRPVLEVSTYGKTRADSLDLHSQVEHVLLDHYFGGQFGGVALDMCRPLAAGLQLPYEAPDVRRFVSTWQMSLRRLLSS